jgi:hypothetical protein
VKLAPEGGSDPILVRLKCRLLEKRPVMPVKTGPLLCRIQPSILALSPDLSDCRNRGLHDIGLLHLHVSFTVKNDGTIEGAEVPQVYLGIDYAGESPLRLGGWSKIHLKPGASQQVDITVSPRTQSIWDTSATDWRYIPDAAAYVGSSKNQRYPLARSANRDALASRDGG